MHLTYIYGDCVTVSAQCQNWRGHPYFVRGYALPLAPPPLGPGFILLWCSMSKLISLKVCPTVSDRWLRVSCAVAWLSYNCAGIFQRQRIDADTDNDYWRSDAAARTDSGRGSRHETRSQLHRHAGQAWQMSSRHDAYLRTTTRQILYGKYTLQLHWTLFIVYCIVLYAQESRISATV